ncbi:MAG: hypothetical protein HKM04_05185 [Legionellales bacterium]|nr:hypothetical protein [Legionellales bacterium]
MSIIDISGNCVYVNLTRPNGYVKFSQDKKNVYAEAFAGKSFSPIFNVEFSTIEKAFYYVEKWLDAFDKRQQAILNNRKERAKAQREYKHPFKVGDIFYTSWGYEQTNLDFFEVVAVPSVKTITLSEIGMNAKQEGYRCCKATPAKGVFLGEPFSCRVTVGDSLRINSHYGHKWDGNPKYFSSYA